MINCVWYVSGFRRPWEAAAIGSLAEALRAKGLFSPRVYADGGTANLEDALSWRSLTLFERLAVVLFKGRLWHLWGPPPFWWPLVRLRARTVHTSLDEKTDWKGYPTRLFMAAEGESAIRPPFEVKAAPAGGDRNEDSTPALILAALPGAPLRDAIEESGTPVVSLTELEAAGVFSASGVLFAGNSPSDALLAACLTTRGIPVLASDTPLLRAVLGQKGFVAAPQGEGKDAWKRALETAMSEGGKAAAANARRFLHERRGSAGAAESLENVYRSAAKGRL
jgi:hypothetical protein